MQILGHKDQESKKLLLEKLDLQNQKKMNVMSLVKKRYEQSPVAVRTLQDRKPQEGLDTKSHLKIKIWNLYRH